MSLSKSKCWYSNNCLHYLKRAVPFHPIFVVQAGVRLVPLGCYHQARMYNRVKQYFLLVCKSDFSHRASHKKAFLNCE